MHNKPAEIGVSIADIDTPALVVDLDALDRNIERMASVAAANGVRLRAHSKTHKSPDIAKLQIAAGAVGICCQKVSEAEVFADHGITDILISNEVVGDKKLRRLAELAKRVKLAVCVDDAANVADMDRIARAAGVTIDCLVEIDVGHERCGIQPGRPAADLARQVADAENLLFAGLQAYNGRAQHFRPFEDRKAAIETAAAMVRETEAELDRYGLKCRTVAGAGTGSFEFEAESGVFNELQCGSYVFMDADYGRNFERDGTPFARFENSLFLLTSVMSKTRPERAVCDAGLKSQSVDSGLPLVHRPEGLAYISANDEHGIISDPDNTLRLGDRLALIPGHCDPTVNIHDWLVGYRGDRVETVWPVAARGMLL